MPKQRSRGMAAHFGPGALARGTEGPAQAAVGAYGGFGPGQLAGGKGSPAKVAVGAYGGPVGDGSSQRPGPTD